MARQEINQEFNTFVGGILTEANPINYPAGFTLDEENFVLERNGTRRRRRGLDFDSGTNPPSFGSTWSQLSNEFGEKNFTIWENVGVGDVSKDLLVILDNLNYIINFYDMSDLDDITSNLIGSVTLPTASAGIVTSILADGDYLYVATNRTTITPPASTVGAVPSYVTAAISSYEYDSSTDTVSLVETTPLFVRDFNIANTSLEDDERPAVITSSTRYDLINGGWSSANITAFQASVGSYPARADNMNTGLSDTTGVFTPSWVTNSNNGVTSTVRGRGVVDIFKPERWRQRVTENESGVATNMVPRVNNDPFIKKMVVFNGRVFYLCSNVLKESGGFPGLPRAIIAFSQTLNSSVEAYRNCHSINDPTSRDNPFPLDTDGGYLTFSDLGDVLDIVPLKTRLIVFGTKGVFEIVSALDIFKPSEIAIRKITSTAMNYQPSEPNSFDSVWLFGSSAVVVGENVFYFTEQGISVLTSETDTNNYVSIPVSDSIKTLYQGIPAFSKATARGTYSPNDNTVRWLYKSTEPGTSPDRNALSKDTELVYDITLKAWYKNTFTEGDSQGDIPVLYSPFVVDTGGIQTQSSYPVDNNLRYIGIGKVGVQIKPRFFRYSDTNFLDYDTAEGSSGYAYTSFLQTGYINLGDTQRYKQSSYIVPSFLRTEDGFTDDGNGNLTPTNESSCMISAWWDYVDDASQPKANDPFEAYRYNRLYIPEDASDTFDYGQSVLTTKNRLTGRGRALSLRFEFYFA